MVTLTTPRFVDAPIVAASMDDLSQHFSWHEFACHDGTEVPAALRANVKDLCSDLEVLRAELAVDAGKEVKIKVTSGFRTETHNAAIGGEPGSMHCKGRAADIKAEGYSGKRLAQIAMQMIDQGKFAHVRGVGEYPGRVHLDTRRSFAYWKRD